MGDYLIYNGALYQVGPAPIAVGDTLTAGTNIAETTVADALAQKANVDGYYENLTAGNAEQLVATVGVTDQTPYNFRTSGGTADIGDREAVNAIVGGTVCWNQIMDTSKYKGTGTVSGVTFKNNGNGSWTLSGTPDSSGNNYYYLATGAFAQQVSGHVYLYGLSGISTNFKGTGWYPGIGVNGPTNYVKGSKPFNVAKSTANGNLVISIQFTRPSDTAVSETFYPVIYDLTRMFGTAIADAVYALEQASAGAGVTWFRKLFPATYYAYNAGELMSVQAAQHKMVGFNQFNSATASEGAIVAANGGVAPNAACSVTDFIPVFGGMRYYFKINRINSSSLGMAWYDIDKKYVSGIIFSGTGVVGLQTAPANACFVRATFMKAQRDTVCISLSRDGKKDGTYEPYQAWEYPLDSTLTLRGIPKLDTNGNLYYDGDRYLPDGTVTRRFGVVTFDGSSDESLALWSSSNPTRLRMNWAGVKRASANTARANIFCPDHTVRSVNRLANYDTDYGIGVPDYLDCFLLYVENVSGLAAYKAWLAEHPVTVVYELATPAAESAEAYTQIQQADAYGTEEYADARDVAIPAGHNTFYNVNLREKIEEAPDSPASDGDYIVRRANGQNTYVALPKELPTLPSNDGAYTLQVTIVSGTPTLSWVAANTLAQ